MNIISMVISTYRLGKASKEKIAEVQLKRLQQLIDYTRQHSPYFKELYQNVPAVITDVSQLPVTTKPELMENFNGWVTDPGIQMESLRIFINKKETIGDKYLDKYFICTTSGTTGQPAVIVHDTDSRKIYYAIGFLRNLLPRLSLINIITKVKAAAVVATDGHYLGYTTLVHRVKNSRVGQKLQKILPVLTPVYQLVGELNNFKPNVLAGYPTAIYLLAKEQIQKKLNISPYVITVSGETLHPYMRNAMEKAFGSVVINNYGASEVPGLTSECKFQKLHLNSDWYILEIIDRRNVLVTNLTNLVQPIIRYKMNDFVSIDEKPCKCGSQHLVITVVGRDDEILSFISARGEEIEILPLAITTVAEESNGVYQSQIVQESQGRIKIRIKAIEGNDEMQVRTEARHNLENFLKGYGLANVIVEISDELPMTNPKSGKFRSVIVNNKS